MPASMGHARDRDRGHGGRCPRADLDSLAIILLFGADVRRTRLHMDDFWLPEHRLQINDGKTATDIEVRR